MVTSSRLLARAKTSVVRLGLGGSRLCLLQPRPDRFDPPKQLLVVFYALARGLPELVQTCGGGADGGERDIVVAHWDLHIAPVALLVGKAGAHVEGAVALVEHGF